MAYVAAFLLRDGQSLLDIPQAHAESPSSPHLRFNSDRSATTLNPDSIRAMKSGSPCKRVITLSTGH